MSVRNGFTIEIYRFIWIAYVPIGTCRSGCHRDGMEIVVEDSEDRTRTSPDVWKTVNCSTKG